MEKKKIETFIKKYNLGGLNDSVIWTNKVEDLSVTTITSDKKLFASVQLEKAAVGFIDGVEVGVLTTDRLKRLLGGLDENISLGLDIDENDKTRVRQILLGDSKTDVNYVTAEPSAIDGVPSMKNVPPFDVEIILDSEFVSRFNKFFSSLSDDGALFTLVMSKKKKKLEMVLGYKENLSDRAATEVVAVAGKDSVKAPISFSAKALKEILSANNEVENPVLKVAEAGLASIAFDKDGLKSQYYLVKVDVED